MQYRDDGHGITQKSLTFWNDHKTLIGQVFLVTADKDYVSKIRAVSEDAFPHILDYSLKINGKLGSIYLSGCNCGYNGEGPNGTRKILEELGIPHNEAGELITKENFKIVISQELEKENKK